jgi:hypothetical protein
MFIINIVYIYVYIIYYVKIISEANLNYRDEVINFLIVN